MVVFWNFYDNSLRFIVVFITKGIRVEKLAVSPKSVAKAIINGGHWT